MSPAAMRSCPAKAMTVCGVLMHRYLYPDKIKSILPGWKYRPSGRLFAPQPRRGNVGAGADRFELEPDHRFDHPFAPREGAEAAIGRGNDAFAVADGRHRFLDAPRHYFGVLDEIAGRLDNARNKNHVARKRHSLERR